MNNDRVTFHLTANVLLFKWGAFFVSFSPASFFPPSLIQSSAATLEWNMAIITFYLGWARSLALTFPLLLRNDGWLLGERLADWRIGGRVGCCCKGRTKSGIFSHLHFFVFDTTRLKSLFHCLLFRSSARCTNKLHYEWEPALIWLRIAAQRVRQKGEWSAVRLRRAHARGKRRETYTVLMSADVRQEAVVTRGLCHLSCRKLWQVQIPCSRCTFGIKIFFFLSICVYVCVCVGV